MVTHWHAEVNEYQRNSTHDSEEGEGTPALRGDEERRGSFRATEVKQPVKRHHDRHVETSNSYWKDFRVDQIWRTEPTNCPSDRVNKYSHDRQSGRVLQRWMFLNLCSGLPIGSAQVSCKNTERDDLHAYPSNERTSSADEIDNHESEEQCRQKLDQTVYTCC